MSSGEADHNAQPKMPPDEAGTFLIDCVMIPYRYTFKARLGGGTFGSVYAVDLLVDNHVRGSNIHAAAVKRLQLPKGESWELTSARLAGERRGALMTHPLVRKVLGIQASAASLGCWDIVYLHRYSTDLKQWYETVLLRVPQKMRDEFWHKNLPCLAFILLQWYLYMRSIKHVHADLKPANIVLSLIFPEDSAEAKATASKYLGDSASLVISDYGSCFELDSLQSRIHSAQRGTRGFRPPESLLPNGAFLDSTCDIYSIGSTLYSLCEGKQWEEGGGFVHTPVAWRSRIASWLSQDPKDRLRFPGSGDIKITSFVNAESELELASASPTKLAERFCRAAGEFTAGLSANGMSLPAPFLNLAGAKKISPVLGDEIQVARKKPGQDPAKPGAAAPNAKKTATQPSPTADTAQAEDVGARAQARRQLARPPGAFGPVSMPIRNDQHIDILPPPRYAATDLDGGDAANLEGMVTRRKRKRDAATDVSAVVQELRIEGQPAKRPRKGDQHPDDERPHSVDFLRSPQYQEARETMLRHLSTMQAGRDVTLSLAQIGTKALQCEAELDRYSETGEDNKKKEICKSVLKSKRSGVQLNLFAVAAMLEAGCFISHAPAWIRSFKRDTNNAPLGLKVIILPGDLYLHAINSILRRAKLLGDK
eukprot:TRINITY_DN1633_c0_g1_i2.p1 TRINITY_DN1633_c0_g1~~TRINITY_DN1633_c0_g1_i2.p1  ORF type:complete len:652 (+),score=114.02 TRINITY_DN1633_c0_g1_i2:61-2016(+)